MKRFDGAEIVVTGGSRGLGRSIAEAFAAEGARVWIGFRSREADAAETAAAIAGAGGRARVLSFDVRSEAAVEAAFDQVLAEAKQLDVLVNCAGVNRDGWFPLLDREAWDEVMKTNLDGTVLCTRAAVRPMWRRRQGAIINVCSVSGLRASPGQANYASSKGALLALTRTLGAELAPKGIRVNAVVPGLIAAGMVGRLDARLVAEKAALIPAGRLGAPEEVAKAVLFLASDDARYIVGQALAVDGGMTL
jgi:3-oxoacyl-[acyl-carrier protein] reductase